MTCEALMPGSTLCVHHEYRDRCTVGDHEQPGGAPINGWHLLEPPEPPEAEAEEHGHVAAEAEPYTELGVARRLIQWHGTDLRHVVPWRQWLRWDSCRWAPDNTGEAARRAKQTARAILHQAADISAAEVAKAVEKVARRAETASGIRSILELAGTEPQVALHHDQLDAHPWLLNCRNGVLNLKTGELGPHDRDLLLTKVAGSAYDENAKAPRFHAFLERVQPDPEMRAFLARLFGQALPGEVVEHILAILFGTGANGKTTLTEIVTAALGDYASQADPGLLIDRGDVHPTGIADLFGRRLVITTETDGGRRLAEGTVKRLTGGDTIKARRMRENFWEFKPSHSLVMHTNHRPKVQGTDEGIWRRLRVVPFETVIPETERDPKLTATIISEELSGVLAWLVRGCLDWQRDGLNPPGAVTTATDEYRAESDALGRFIADRCIVRPDSVAASVLFAAWSSWCAVEGTEVGTKTAFTRQLAERGHNNSRSHGQTRIHGLVIDHESTLGEPGEWA